MKLIKDDVAVSQLRDQVNLLVRQHGLAKLVDGGDDHVARALQVFRCLYRLKAVVSASAEKLAGPRQKLDAGRYAVGVHQLMKQRFADGRAWHKDKNALVLAQRLQVLQRDLGFAATGGALQAGYRAPC